MKNSTLSLIVALSLPFAMAGCFGGEESDPTAPVDPKDTAKAVKKVSPGLYVGDYSPYDPDGAWESEFTLTRDGDFRLYWIYGNDPIGDLRGKWFQRDSTLHFTGIGETYIDDFTGYFGPHASVEDDTNSVRDITDSSFTRKEWTPLRQKPYWVTYRKRSFDALGQGNYGYSREYQVDSAVIRTKVDITLDGAGFLYRETTDTVETYQAAATWYQIGSIFATENNRERFYDTTLHSLGEWDSLPGALLLRIQQVSDTGFQLWTGRSWDAFRKL